MKNVLIAILTSLSFTLPAQSQELKAFNAVDVFGPFKVEMIQSEEERIEMEYVNVNREDIVIEVRRGELQLKLKTKHYWTDWDSNKHKKSQYIITKIYFKKLDELKASAGASITFNKNLATTKFTVSGSMGAEIWLPIETNVLFAKSNMGATVNLKGKASYMEVLGKMGGIVKASQLECKSAFVSASMGSNVTVNATEEVDIAANFGADVRYLGNPSIRHTNKRMGADIGSVRYTK